MTSIGKLGSWPKHQHQLAVLNLDPCEFSLPQNGLIILVKIKWDSVCERNVNIENLGTTHKNLWSHEVPLVPFLGDQ